MGGQELLGLFAQDDHCVVGAAEAPGGPDHRLQDRLHIGRRLGDGTQDLGSGGLLLQRLLSSVNSRTFSIAITAWAAKVSSSWICCGVNGPGSTLRRTTAPMAAPSRFSGAAKRRESRAGLRAARQSRTRPYRPPRYPAGGTSGHRLWSVHRHVRSSERRDTGAVSQGALVNGGDHARRLHATGPSHRRATERTAALTTASSTG